MAQTIDTVAQLEGDPSPSRGASSTTSLGHLLRRVTARWPVLVVVALLCGGLAGLATVSGGTTYASTALVRLSASSEDSARTEQIAQTVERTTVSSPVVDAAAAATGASSDDLQDRVTAQWESDTDVIEVTVQGSDPETVVAETNAVLESLQQFYDEQTRQEIEELSVQGDQLLSSGALDEDSAEAARRSGVGTVLADRQGAAAAGWATVTPLEPATEAQVIGLSLPIAVALGGFVGLVLAAGLLLVLPFRRRKVRRLSDVDLIAPGVPSLRSSGVGPAELVGLLLDSERDALAIVSAGDVHHRSVTLAHDVVDLLRAHGLSTGLVDATTPPTTPGGEALAEVGAAATVTPDSVGQLDLARYQFLGHHGRAAAMQQQGVETLVLLAPARPETISLLAGQPDVVVAVAISPKQVRADELRRLLALLRHSHPVVVLLS